MALVKMKELLSRASADKYAVGAFEFWSLDSVRAILEAAEELKQPVILQAGPGELNYMGWKNAERAVIYAAEHSPCEVAVHLDHSNELKWIKMALESGFTSVMMDASHLCFEENVDLTREVVAMAARYGVTVESELGRLPGAEGAIEVEEAEAFQTKTREAVEFVRLTGIDCLAIAVGTVHGFYRSEPNINIERIREIRRAVSTPLVLHGGSGIPDVKVTEAIEAGISKVNVCTEFMDAFGKSYTGGYRPSLKGLFEPAFQAGKKVIAEKIRLFSNEY